MGERRGDRLERRRRRKEWKRKKEMRRKRTEDDDWDLEMSLRYKYPTINTDTYRMNERKMKDWE